VATNNRTGFFFDGADANACSVTGCDARANRQWGFWDSSFLGNTFVGCKTASNGWDGALGSIPTACTIGNNRFYVKPGQATGASTNPPVSSVVTMTIASPAVITWTAHGLVAGTPIGLSTTGALPTGLTAGTTYYVVSPAANSFSLAASVGGAAINTSGTQSGVHTASAAIDNTYWGYVRTGGTFNGIVAWVSGTTFREGGCYKTDNSNATSVFLGCYAEGDQNPSQVQGPSIVFGGNMGTVSNAPNIRSDSTGDLQLGPVAGYPATSTTYFESTGSVRYLRGRYWLGGNATSIGSFGFQNGGGILYDVDNVAYSHFFRINGTLVGTIDTNGLNLASGKVYKVNSTQVVAARDTGWTADTGTAKKTATATYAPGSNLTYSAAYVQAEQTATSTRLQLIEAALRDATQEIKALKDALIAHGLIGT
jgi:hypothetical protein